MIMIHDMIQIITYLLAITQPTILIMTFIMLISMLGSHYPKQFFIYNLNNLQFWFDSCLDGARH